MKIKFLILNTLAIVLVATLMSCSNTPKKSRVILGELTIDTPISSNFSKFSGTESYEFTISKPTKFSYDLRLRNGTTYISLIDENKKEYFSTKGPAKDTIELNPTTETKYFIDLKYDNGIGTYSLSINH